MNNNDQNSFFNPRTLIAIGVTFAFLVLWQSYLGRKYSQKPSQITQNAPQVQAPAERIQAPTVPTASNVPQESKDQTEVLTSFEDENWSLKFSSKGMGVKDVVLKSYKNRKLEPVILAQGVDRGIFETRLLGLAQDLHFSIQKKSQTEFEGVAQVGTLTVTKNVNLNSQDYSFNTRIVVSGSDANIQGLQTMLPEKLVPTAGASIFSPALDHQSSFVSSEEKSDRFLIDAHVEKMRKAIANGEELPKLPAKQDMVQIASVGTLYFMSAIVDNSTVRPDYTTQVDLKNELYGGELSYPWVNKDKPLEVSYVGFSGPKSLTVLNRIDTRLTHTVDFGMFSLLARPMLTVLKWFYSVTANWGVAIILLTLLVRALVLPFNVMSYRSMKAMATINPQMQALREKYKEDPQRMNVEVMALMKQNNVNPLGGCLPMLLQMPVFFALYRVLGNSIELYQAPFMLWIHDLSLKDPYFVLPVLMGITMFIQQKITPTTMDPAQARVMLIMPVIFSFMMVALPSGLTLYIFVSTLFGIIQQKVFMRDSKPKVKPVEVKA